MSPRSVYLPESETESQNSILSETDPFNGLTQVRVAKTETEFEAGGRQNDSEDLISSQTSEIDAGSGQTTIGGTTFGQSHPTSGQELCLINDQDVTPTSDQDSNLTNSFGQFVRPTTGRQFFPLTPFTTSKPKEFHHEEEEKMENRSQSTNFDQNFSETLDKNFDDEELCSPPTPQNFPLTQLVPRHFDLDDEMELDRSQNDVSSNVVSSNVVKSQNIEMDFEVRSELMLDQEMETGKSEKPEPADHSSNSDLDNDEQSCGSEQSSYSGFNFQFFHFNFRKLFICCLLSF